jgi:hypothetical protein
MKTKLDLAVLAVWFLFVGAVQSLRADNSVAPPNLLWHHKNSGLNKVWVMTGGTTFDHEISLPPNSDDPGWKMIGTGDFNHDGKQDIIWQHSTLDLLGIWYMNSDSTVQSYSVPNPNHTGDINWRMVGVADFDKDGYPDLLWENRVTRQHCIWLMTGPNYRTSSLISEPADPGWKVACAADFGQGPGNPKRPGILWRHQTTGDIALWYMNGFAFDGSAQFYNPGPPPMQQQDQDEQIVAGWDVDNDGYGDIYWRHSTLGINGIWFFTGNIFKSGTFPSVANAPEWSNTDWRLPGQDWTDSRWRLSFEYRTPLTASVGSSPPQITLTAQVAMAADDRMTIWRRIAPSLDWGTSPYRSGLSSATFPDPDTALQIDKTYEYKVTFTGSSWHRPAFIKAAITRPATALENRGTIVVLRDADLVSNYPDVMNSILNLVTNDLIADGWTVACTTAARHNFANPGYSTSLQNIKNYISGQSGVKGVLIIGHVTIPYSGWQASDGHSHNGAWPADMFYGSTSPDPSVI